MEHHYVDFPFFILNLSLLSPTVVFGINNLAHISQEKQHSDEKKHWLINAKYKVSGDTSTSLILIDYAQKCQNPKMYKQLNKHCETASLVITPHGSIV